MQIQTKLVLFLYLTFYANSFGQEKRQIIKKAELKEINNSEFAEVLHEGRLISEKSNEEFSVKVFSSNNGPGNPNLEECDFSTNYYISVRSSGFPLEFKLFKVGPFYQVINSSLLDDAKSKSFKLRIRHKSGSKQKVRDYSISFGKMVPSN